MRKTLLLFLAAVAIAGCDQDDTPVETTGSVSFVVNGSGLGAGRIAGLTPERLVVSIEDKDGKTILDNKIFALTPVDRGYSTETVRLEKGQYRLTKYLVISGQTAAYATPKSGAEKANLIDSPLPIEFPIDGSEQSFISPKIIGISADDVPGNFGYSDFGFDTPETPGEEWMSVRIKLEMILGGIFYPNVDAPVVVKAFDPDKNLAWEDEFTYTGPGSTDLKIKTGFSTYTIEIRKWGATLTQTFIGTDLWEGRVREGVVPLTRVFQANVEPKQIKNYITSWSKVINGVTVMEPLSKTRHDYNEGRIYLITNSAYDKSTGRYIDQSLLQFNYEGNRVKKIETFLAGQDTPVSEDTYTYDANGRASHIQHKVLTPGSVSSDVDLIYLNNDRLVKASYRFSNGTGFEYEMENQNGSMKADRTTKGSELCSEGTYAYDKGVNPLKHLGYTDYLLRNFSIANRLTEDVNYLACAFPSLVPESYNYVYDEDGYPVRATTNYKGGKAKTETEYTYLQ